jgi:hypothetical protein
MKSSFSSCPHHEIFEELAALAAVGELSALEQERLRHHLAECPHCREIYEAFATLASNDLGVAAAGRESLEPVALDVTESEAREHLGRLRSLMSTAETGLGLESRPYPTLVKSGDAASKNRLRLWLRRSAVYGIAAALLVAATVVGGSYFRRLENAASAERVRSRELQSVVDSLKRQRTNDQSGSDGAVLRSLQETQKARDALQKYLAASKAKNEELLAREKASEEKLAGAIATTEQLKQQVATNDGDLQRLAKLQQDSEAKLHEALVELYQSRQAPVQVTAKGEARDDANLASDALPSADSGPTPASPSETEARNLFGARDLHIVDVYDVRGDGETKRTYGRVYYVEKKLLVFYAFDLQNRQNHKSAVFQAWGYREAKDGKPLNLGLFTIDDSGMSRWVLTVNRPYVLSHIDAVFVTVEPPGGSTAPRGKKVLYANLVGPPNHP